MNTAAELPSSSAEHALMKFEQPLSADRHGLGNLRSRAEATGGTLSLVSKVGEGTTLTAEIPIKEAD